MELLGIQDVTTNRQRKNGTVQWRLPIKNNHPGYNTKLIEVASFKTGYVRNQNSGYSNYQLNKRCEGEPEYFELPNGDYRRFSTRSCILIPREIDRLEYLIKFMKLVEKEEGEVVGLCFEDNNVDVIIKANGETER